MATYTTVREDREYIPEWDDNRNESEPMKFVLNYWTSVQNDMCIKTGFNEKGETHVEFDYGNIIKFGVKSIDNLVVDGEKIETAAQFNRLPGAFSNLRMEICTELLSMNQRQASKN